MAENENKEGMFTHYGLFWSKHDVRWGVQGKAGELLGKTPDSKKEKDFRDYGGVYALFNDYDLVYVGQAGIESNHTLYHRLNWHRRSELANRWNRFSWFGAKKEQITDKDVKVREALKQLEAVSIALINPDHNKQSGAFKGAKQVYQIPHPEADGSIETKLKRIDEKLEKLAGIEKNFEKLEYIEKKLKELEKLGNIDKKLQSIIKRMGIEIKKMGRPRKNN